MPELEELLVVEPTPELELPIVVFWPPVPFAGEGVLTTPEFDCTPVDPNAELPLLLAPFTPEAAPLEVLPPGELVPLAPPAELLEELDEPTVEAFDC